MRVALNVEQLLYRAPGGIGRYTAKLLTLLPGLAPDDTIIAFTARHSAGDVARALGRFGVTRSDGFAPVRLPVPRPLLYQAWNLFAIPSLDRLSPALAGVDLIHAPSVAVPPRRPGRLVVTVHDVAPLLFPETFPRRGRWFHARGLQAAAARADLIITVSEAAAAEIEAHTTIARSRLRVVPNGVDAAPATPEAVAATLERFRLADLPYVLWVGSLEPRKDVGTLVSAFTRLVDAEHIPHRLVLAGPSGWLEDGQITAVDRSRLGDRLRTVGQVTDADLPGLYAGADVFAFPSRHEGFGLPVLEAMAQGTPVLASDIPALQEVAGGAAHLVPPASVDEWARALHELLDDDDARRRLAAAGRARAAGFSWERTVAATIAVYREVLAG